MDTSMFISGQLIPIRMVSSPLSPSGECEGEKTELSPLSPLLSPLGSAKGTKSESIPLNPPTGEEGMRGDKRGGWSGLFYFISYLLPVSSTTRRQ